MTTNKKDYTRQITISAAIAVTTWFFGTQLTEAYRGLDSAGRDIKIATAMLDENCKNDDLSKKEVKICEQALLAQMKIEFAAERAAKAIVDAQRKANRGW